MKVQQMQQKSNPLQNYQIIQSFSTHLLLQDKTCGSKSVYKEFRVPDFISDEDFRSIIELRRSISSSSLINIHMVLLDQQENGGVEEGQNTRKFGLLYEAPLIDFQQEILKRIAANCYWTEEEIFNTLELVLEGLKSLHNNCLVHGDLRAKNIVFCEDKNIKIADQFVFSSQFIKKVEDILKDQNTLLAPEVIEGKQFSIEGDLWSLGMLFLEAASLQRSKELYRWPASTPQKQFVDPEVDFDKIWERIQGLQQNYSLNFISLITCLLNEDPTNRLQIYEFLNQMYAFQQSQQQPSSTSELKGIQEVNETTEEENDEATTQRDIQLALEKLQKQESFCQETALTKNDSFSIISYQPDSFEIQKNDSQGQLHNIDKMLKKSNSFKNQEQFAGQQFSKQPLCQMPSFSNLENSQCSNRSSPSGDHQQLNNTANDLLEMNNDCQTTQKLDFSKVLKNSSHKKESSENVLRERQKNLNNLIDECLNKSKQIIQKSSQKQFDSYDYSRDKRQVLSEIQQPREQQETEQPQSVHPQAVDQTLKIKPQEIGNIDTIINNANHRQKENLNEKFEKSVKRSKYLLEEKSQHQNGSDDQEKLKKTHKLRLEFHQQRQIIQYKDGSFYEGQTFNGMRDGFGVLFGPEQELIYQGEWKEDSYHGVGVLFNRNPEFQEQDQIDYKNLDNLEKIWIKYHGDFVDGVKHGLGMFQFINGETFHGTFSNGTIQGKGTYRTKANKQILGAWNNNRYNVNQI